MGGQRGRERGVLVPSSGERDASPSHSELDKETVPKSLNTWFILKLLTFSSDIHWEIKSETARYVQQNGHWGSNTQFLPVFRLYSG